MPGAINLTERVNDELDALVDDAVETLSNNIETAWGALSNPRFRATPAHYSWLFLAPMYTFMVCLRSLTEVGRKAISTLAREERERSGMLRSNGRWTPDAAHRRDALTHRLCASAVTPAADSPAARLYDAAHAGFEVLIPLLPRHASRFASPDEAYELIETLETGLQYLRKEPPQSRIFGGSKIGAASKMLLEIHLRTLSDTRDRLKALRDGGPSAAPLETRADAYQLASDLVAVAVGDFEDLDGEPHFSRRKLSALHVQVGLALQPLMRGCRALMDTEPTFAAFLAPSFDAMAHELELSAASRRSAIGLPSAELKSLQARLGRNLLNLMDQLAIVQGDVPHDGIPGGHVPSGESGKHPLPLIHEAEEADTELKTDAVVEADVEADASARAGVRSRARALPQRVRPAVESEVDSEVDSEVENENESEPEADVGAPAQGSDNGLHVAAAASRLAAATSPRASAAPRRVAADPQLRSAAAERPGAASTRPAAQPRAIENASWDVLADRLRRDAALGQIVAPADMTTLSMRLKSYGLKKSQLANKVQILVALCLHVDAHTARGYAFPFNALRTWAVLAQHAPLEQRRIVSDTLARNLGCKPVGPQSSAELSRFLRLPETNLDPLIRALAQADNRLADEGFDKLARCLEGVDAEALRAALMAERQESFSLPEVDDAMRKRILESHAIYGARVVASLLPEIERSPSHLRFVGTLLQKVGLDVRMLTDTGQGRSVAGNVVDLLARELPDVMFSRAKRTTRINAHDYDKHLSALVVTELMRRSDRPIRVVVGAGSHSDQDRFEEGLPPVRLAVYRAAAAAGWQVQTVTDSAVLLFKDQSDRVAGAHLVNLGAHSSAPRAT